VVLDNGETLPADFVVVGAGIIPNTELVKGIPIEKVRLPFQSSSAEIVFVLLDFSLRSRFGRRYCMAKSCIP
jgi:hypothetical protein